MEHMTGMALSNPTIGGVDINMAWSEVEPQQGVLNFAPLDAEMRDWAQAGKQFILIVRYANEETFRLTIRRPIFNSKQSRASQTHGSFKGIFKQPPSWVPAPSSGTRTMQPIPITSPSLCDGSKWSIRNLIETGLIDSDFKCCSWPLPSCRGMLL